MNKLFPAVVALIVLLAFGVSAHSGQKYRVKVIDRQDNNSTYTYAAPGYSTTSTNANANCSGYGHYANCNGNSTTTTTSTAPVVGSYAVRGATLSLQLPDGRVAVVNCDAKFNWSEWSNPNMYRSCRIPMVADIETEFDGDKAKLRWSVSIDGKKMQSETYKILAVLDPPKPPPAPASTVSPAADFAAVEAAFKARHNITPDIEREIVELGNSGKIVPGNMTPDEYLETLYEIVMARHSVKAQP